MISATKIASLDDVALLELLCKTNEDQLLYESFVNRFYKEVFERCKSICIIRNIDPHVGQEITSEVFERVRKYKTFKSKEVNLPNRQAIMVYLHRYVLNLFYDYHKNLRKDDTTHRTYFDDLKDDISKIDPAILKDKREISSLIFSKLNKKEQRVITTDLENKRHKHLPHDVVEKLAQELKVKPATIRKIRERAIEKIKKFIDEINKN